MSLLRLLPVAVRRAAALLAVVVVTVAARRLDDAGYAGHVLWVCWCAVLSVLPPWLGAGARAVVHGQGERHDGPAPPDDELPTDEFVDVIPFRPPHGAGTGEESEP